MPVISLSLELETHGHADILNITNAVQQAVQEAGAHLTARSRSSAPPPPALSPPLNMKTAASMT